MNNNEIVEAVSGDVKAMISNMAIKDEHRDDLFQEIIIILLGYNNAKLDDLYQKKQIKFFISRIICNQYYSVHSYFYKTYKKYEDKKYKLSDYLNNNEGNFNEKKADKHQGTDE